MSHLPVINRTLLNLIDQIMRSPNRSNMLRAAMETLADLFIPPVADNGDRSEETGGQLRSDMQGLSYVPDEILNEIALNLNNRTDITNMRLVSKRFARATAGTFVRSLAWDRTITPRYDSAARFLAFLVRFPQLRNEIRDLTLVSEGLRKHEYGYEWAWEDFQHWENVDATDADLRIIRDINYAHARDIRKTGRFINAGRYRVMLGLVLAYCPNLSFITCRKIKAGEHLEGWVDPAKFQQLSFWRPNLNFRALFYGDWQYDTTHLRVTQYKDEFGDIVSEPGAGPQASFIQDLHAALEAHGNGRTEILNDKCHHA